MKRFLISTAVCWILGMVLWPSIPSFAQIPQFHVSHTSDKAELSHQTVTQIMRDSRGFLWISTMDGLNRFDGRRMKVYRHIPDDSSTISDSFIHGVTEFDDGNLWISTRDGGINILDPVTDSIRRIIHQPDDSLSIPDAPVNLLYKDSFNILWAGFFYNKLGYLDAETEHFYPVQLVNSISGKPVQSINSILEFGDGSFLLTSYQGIYFIPSSELQAFRSDPTQQQLEILVNPVFLNNENPTPNSFHAMMDSDRQIWVFLLPGGVQKIEDRFIPGKMKQSMLSGVISKQDNIILEDGDYILFGSEKGKIGYINKKTGERDFQQISNVENEESGAKIFRDQEGIIWFASWGGGVYQLKKKEGISLFNRNKTANRLPSNFMLAFSDTESALWIGTAQGLARLNTSTQKVTPVDLGIPDVSIWSMQTDEKGLWLSTRAHGLILIPESQLDNNNPEIIRFTTSNSLLLNDNVHQVFTDKRDWLWIGYEGSGIQIIKNKTDWLNGSPANLTEINSTAAENALPSDNIRKITEDSAGNIWVAMNDQGFSRLHISEHAIQVGEHFSTTSEPGNRLYHNDARSVFQQNDSTWWFGTYGGGIHRWVSTSNSMLNLTTVQGLANNSTYGILPDSHPDYLWVSTNNGLSRLNTRSLRFTNFTVSDGLQNNEFNTGAYHLMDDGRLVYGGVNGFNIIDTEQLSADTSPPDVFFTEIRLFDNPLNSDSTALFRKSLELNYDQNFLSFEFAALDLIAPNEVKYAYKMDGVDASWVMSGNRAYASYPNLEPGHYTFHVKAANGDGYWSANTQKIAIQIRPPWWQTLWFRMIAGTAIIGLFVGIIRYFSQKKLREQLRKMEIENRLRNERERISRDLHDHVGAQLANIISGLSLVDKYNEFNQPEKSTQLMKSLKGDAEVTIKQLRDTIWALNQSKLEVQDFVHHLGNYFKTQSALTELIQINYHVEDEEKTILSSTQALNLFRIIQEASQNTLKYSGGNELNFSFIRNNGSLAIIIADNGTFKGEETDFNSGYGMKNMRKRAEEINAKINVNTKQGTEVKITLSLEH